MPTRALISLAGLVLACLPATAQATLQNGQSPAEVAALLGPASNQAVFGTAALALYPTIRVYFVSGQLVNAEPRPDSDPNALPAANQLYDHRQFAQAAPLYQALCEDGNAATCLRAGFIYETYETAAGVPVDFVRAGELYTFGCNLGSAVSCGNLAVLFDNGRGAAADEARALALFTQACDASDFHGCANLGYMFEQGRGVPADPSRARQFYAKACDGGDQPGCAARDRLTPHPPPLEERP